MSFLWLSEKNNWEKYWFAKVLLLLTSSKHECHVIELFVSMFSTSASGRDLFWSSDRHGWRLHRWFRSCRDNEKKMIEIRLGKRPSKPYCCLCLLLQCNIQNWVTEKLLLCCNWCHQQLINSFWHLLRVIMCYQDTTKSPEMLPINILRKVRSITFSETQSLGLNSNLNIKLARCWGPSCAEQNILTVTRTT